MNNTKKRSAIILCGGKGTRLGSIGKKIPKTLVKIQGEEILKYILSHLIKYRFDNIIPGIFKKSIIKELAEFKIFFEKIFFDLTYKNNS